jgi:hypothetical protein
MANSNKKLETLEDELKLLKGEVKQSLAGVRDFLLNMELPTSEFATVLAALGEGGGGGSTKMVLEGNLATQEKAKPPAKNDQEVLSEEPEEEPEQPSEDELVDEDYENIEEADINNFDESREYETFLEEEPVNMNDLDSYMPPRVNLLANLITWVARAEKEIGHDQIPAFLEVYGMSGHLTEELKEAILHLSEIAAESQNENSQAETWSQSLLSLHGILTGGDAPSKTLKPRLHNYEAESSKNTPAENTLENTMEMPVKMKLVFSGDNGDGKEYCIDLRPNANNNNNGH